MFNTQSVSEAESSVCSVSDADSKDPEEDLPVDIRQQQHLSPAIRRINLTSDYESSESPSNSEYDESTAMLDDSSTSTIVMPEPLVPEEGEEDLGDDDEQVRQKFSCLLVVPIFCSAQKYGWIFCWNFYDRIYCRIEDFGWRIFCTIWMLSTNITC